MFLFLFREREDVFEPFEHLRIPLVGVCSLSAWTYLRCVLNPMERVCYAFLRFTDRSWKKWKATDSSGAFSM